MADQPAKSAASKAVVIAMRAELARLIAAHAKSAAETCHSDTRPRAFPPDNAHCMLSSCVRAKPYDFVQGRKRINLGGIEYLCDGSSFLVSSIDIPVQSQIVEASEATPLLSMFLRLDMPAVREVLSRDDVPEQETSSQRRGLAVGETTAGLLGACARLIELLGTPDDIRF